MQISKDVSQSCRLPQSASTSGRNASSADTNSPYSFQKVLGKSIREVVDTDQQPCVAAGKDRTEPVSQENPEDAQNVAPKPRPALQEEESAGDEVGQALLMAAVSVVPQEIPQQAEPAEDPLVSLQTAISSARVSETAYTAAPAPQSAQVEEAPPEREAPETPIVDTELEYEDSAPYPVPVTAETPQEQQTRFEQVVGQASRDLDSRAERGARTQNVLEAQRTPATDDEVQTQETTQGGEQTQSRPDRDTWTTAIRWSPESLKPDKSSVKDESKKADETTALNSHLAAQGGVRTQSARTQAMQQPDQAVYQAPDQVEQIRAQVVEQLGNQKMEFNMRLNPEELGEVDVKMVMEGGRLAVQIIAATPEAAELLSKHVDGLAASLRASSIQLDSVQVVGQTQSAQSQMQGAFNMNHSSGSERDPQEQFEGSGEQPSFEDEVPAAEQELDTMLNYEI